MRENTEESIRWLEVRMYYEMLKSIGYSVCIAGLYVFQQPTPQR